MNRFFATSACAALVLLEFGCPEPVDRAAKKRIFSPEDPPKVVSSAGEKLSPENAGNSPETADRILSMSAAETTERIGPYKYASAITFEWSGRGDPVKLAENRSLIAGRGGVKGDFHATIENSRDQGLEVIRTGGEIYARNRYGKFRRRLRDRGMAERIREETFSAVRDIHTLFRQRLTLTSSGADRAEGRTAIKFVVSLRPDGGDGGTATSLASLPAPAEPKGGRDESTKRRWSFFQNRVPRSLSGALWIDAETGVVLRSEFSGALGVPSGERSEPLVKIALRSTLTPLSKEPSLRRPPDSLPDTDKPEGIADVLDRFGLPRAGKGDAGTAAEDVKKSAQSEEE